MQERDPDRLTRVTLGLSCPFNLVAAALLAAPDSAIGQLLGLPTPVPALYRGLTALLIAAFGLAYGWLALQPRLVRPFVAFGALGKAAVFALALALWLLGETPLGVPALAVGDLVFAVIWLRWLVVTA